MVNGVIEFEGDEKRVTSLALRGTEHLFFPRTVKATLELYILSNNNPYRPRMSNDAEWSTLLEALSNKNLGMNQVDNLRE